MMNHVYGGTADEVVIILNTLRDESAILLAFFLLVRFLGLSFGESCGQKLELVRRAECSAIQGEKNHQNGKTARQRCREIAPNRYHIKSSIGYPRIWTLWSFNLRQEH